MKRLIQAIMLIRLSVPSAGHGGPSAPPRPTSPISLQPTVSLSPLPLNITAAKYGGFLCFPSCQLPSSSRSFAHRLNSSGPKVNLGQATYQGHSDELIGSEYLERVQLNPISDGPGCHD